MREIIPFADHQETEELEEECFDLESDGAFNDFMNDFNELIEDEAEGDDNVGMNLPDEVIDMLYHKARQYYNEENYPDAILTFSHLLRILPEETAFWKGLAASMQMEKKYPAAVTAYAFAAAIDPTDPSLPLHGAECCFAAGETVGGLNALCDAEERALKDKSQYAEILSEIAVLRQAWSEKTEASPKKKKKLE